MTLVRQVAFSRFNRLPRQYMKPRRLVGIDAGAETIKAVELNCESGSVHLQRRLTCEHRKNPGSSLRQMLEGWDWGSVAAAAVCGRFAERVDLPHISQKQALLRGYQHFYGLEPVTIIDIGAHGFPSWNYGRVGKRSSAKTAVAPREPAIF
jgi:hypothetical protein